MPPGRAPILLSPPDVGGSERQALLEAFDSGWIAPVGPDIDAFEEEVCAVVGVPHAVALSSGTAALHLALRLLGVERGDTVVVPTLTFVATAAPVVQQGARPVFVDSSPADWNIDPGLLVEELDNRRRAGRLPKAVVAVDLYGQCADYAQVRAACATVGVPLIEDAAEALGARHRGQAAGSFGELNVLSFNGNKIITTSGGGMLTSEREDLIRRARFLATHARDPVPHYQHSQVGYNYRLSNLLAALGRAQLRGLDHKIERRRAINARYRQAFARVGGIELAPVAPHGLPNHWLTCVTVDEEQFGSSREGIRVYLEALGIESRPLWKPLHLQPAFEGCERRGGTVAEGLFAAGLCLPSGSVMSDADVDRVIEGVLEAPAGRPGEPRVTSLPPPRV